MPSTTTRAFLVAGLEANPNECQKRVSRPVIFRTCGRHGTTPSTTRAVLDPALVCQAHAGWAHLRQGWTIPSTTGRGCLRPLSAFHCDTHWVGPSRLSQRLSFRSPTPPPRKTRAFLLVATVRASRPETVTPAETVTRHGPSNRNCGGSLTGTLHQTTRRRVVVSKSPAPAPVPRAHGHLEAPRRIPAPIRARAIHKRISSSYAILSPSHPTPLPAEATEIPALQRIYVKTNSTVRHFSPAAAVAPARGRAAWDTPNNTRIVAM